MSRLSGATQLSEIHNSGTIISTEFEKDNPLGRRLKSLAEAENEEAEYDDVELAEIKSQVCLENAVSEMQLADEKPSQTAALIKPPADAFSAIASKMRPITEDGGILKLVTVTGYPDCTIRDTDYVTVRYSGWLDGRTDPFTSTYFQPTKQIERQIGGVGLAFIGLDYALLSMTKGEKAFFLTCPEYSYGINGTQKENSWPEIPGNAWLLWKVEVINVIAATEHVEDLFQMKEDDRLKLPFSTILAAAESQRQLGKEAFTVNRWISAKRCYERAAKLLVEKRILPEEEAIQKKSLLSKLFCSIAVTIYKAEEKTKEEERNYEDIYENAASAVSFDESNAKAWYWGGYALRRLYRLDESRDYLKKAQELEPRNIDIGKELCQLEKDFKEQKERETVMLKKMVGIDKDEKIVKKVSPGIAHAVSTAFREHVESQLRAVDTDKEDCAQFDLNIYSKPEEEYIVAALSCYQGSLKMQRVWSQLGGEIINVEKAVANGH